MDKSGGEVKLSLVLTVERERLTFSQVDQYLYLFSETDTSCSPTPSQSQSGN